MSQPPMATSTPESSSRHRSERLRGGYPGERRDDGSHRGKSPRRDRLLGGRKRVHDSESRTCGVSTISKSEAMALDLPGERSALTAGPRPGPEAGARAEARRVRPARATGNPAVFSSLSPPAVPLNQAPDCSSFWACASVCLASFMIFCKIAGRSDRAAISCTASSFSRRRSRTNCSSFSCGRFIRDPGSWAHASLLCCAAVPKGLFQMVMSVSAQ